MKDTKTEIILKTILSILFLLCLLKMPYGYYEATRFIGMLGFMLLAYFNYERNKILNLTVIIYLALALLFQPFIKIALGRTIWNIVDIVLSLGLIISIFWESKKFVKTNDL
jgi:hypothetical protein